MSTIASSRTLRRVPADLLGVLVVVALVHAFVFVPVLSESPLRVVIGLPFVLFVPGYALVSAIFPERERSSTTGASETDTLPDGRDRASTDNAVDSVQGVDGWERLALAFGLSLATVVLVAMVVTLSPLAFGAATVIPAVGLFSILCAGVAAGRRLILPPERRFRVSPADWLARTRRSLARTDSRGELLLSTGLAIVVILAAGTLGFAVLAPPDGESYTEFYVLAENAEGDLVATDYPDSVQPGEPEPLSIGIENYESETVDYEVLIQLQRVQGTGTDAVVTERTRIDRYSATLGHNETQVDERVLTVPEGWEGTDLRLEFLLYEGEIPATPTRENAYRNLHIWIDVGVEQTQTVDGQSSTSAGQTATATDSPAGAASTTAAPTGQNVTAASTPTSQNTTTASDRTTTTPPSSENTTATPTEQNTTATPTSPPVAIVAGH